MWRIKMKKFVTVWILCATIALPLSAGTEVEIAVITRAINFHFKRTQPFYRSNHIVAAATRQNFATDELPMVKEVIADARAVEEITAKSGLSAETLTLDKAVDTGVVDLSKFRTGNQYDWRQIAEAYPQADVVFEVSPPIFDRPAQYAVVRLDATRLRGSDTGLPFSILYGLKQGVDHQWEVTQLVAPCCAPKR